MKTNKVSNWFETKFIPTVGKLGNQKHLSAIRDGFAIFTPILIAGAIAILFNTSIFAGAWGGSVKGSLTAVWTGFNDYQVTGGGVYQKFLMTMHMLFASIQMATIQVMSIYVAFAVAYFMSASRGNNTPVIAGLIGLASFLIITPLTPQSYTGWQGGTYWLSANGLISALIISLVSAELFSWLSKDNKMAIKMPAGVPPAVSRAFAKLFPAMVTLGAVAATSTLLFWLPFAAANDFQGGDAMIMGTTTDAKINIASLTQSDYDTLVAANIIDPDDAKITVGSAFKDVASGVSGDSLAPLLKLSTPAVTVIRDLYLPVSDASITTVIFSAIVNPFVAAASSTGGSLGFAFAYVLLISFFWFFGLHGTNIVNGAFSPLWLILYADNVNGGSNVFVQGTFDAFIFVGGWGATLSLVVATIIFGKKGSPSHEVSKFGLAPGLFNINEPITFGYPLVLNGLLIIPLFLVMPTLVFTTYAATDWMGVPVTRTIMPWTTPVGIGGLIATGSAWGFVLAVVNFAIATVIWTPFVLMQKRAEAKNLIPEAPKTKVSA